MPHNCLSFAFGYIRDELSDQLGFYLGTPKRDCLFLDARTLALACDCNGGDAYVMWGHPRLWREENYADAENARTVFLRLDAIAHFAERILPHLSRPIVLVTLESDYSPLLWQPKVVETILASDRIAHWFCAQSDMPRHEKVTPVPLGILYRYRDDLVRLPSLSGYHAMPCNTASFDRAVEALLDARLSPEKRPALALADFAINNTSGDRRHGETRGEIAKLLAQNPNVEIPSRMLPQLELYRRYSQAAFVVSPHGKGLDCYRTWEALLMGAIPIVKRSALDPVYDGFPVVILDDWREITGDNLKRWQEQWASAFIPALTERLTSGYWIDRINAAAARLQTPK